MKLLQNTKPTYGAYAHDLMTAILVFQNNDTTAMLVYQTSPVGVQLFSYVNTFFCSNKFAWLLDTRVNTLYKDQVIKNLRLKSW